MGEPLLEMRDIDKRFGATHALDKVNLDVAPGEVHMLLGENGAGKSTLMKILAGSLQADSGKIYWQGEEVRFKKPQDAFDIGIGMVYQELALIDEMSVMENVLLGNLPRYGRSAFVDWKRAEEKTRSALREVGLENIDPRRKLGVFNLGIRQLIEIAKTLSRNAKLLILDEPTSALTESETETLFGIIKGLKAKGVSFIFITHKLDEAFSMGDRATVFRDGKKIGDTLKMSETKEGELINKMVGRSITEFYPKERNASCDETILTVENFGDGKYFHDVSFDLRAGEVLGIAGLVGSGTTEIAEALYGLYRHTSGKITYLGESFVPSKPSESLQKGIGLLTKNRKSGLLLHLPIYSNITLSNTRDFVKWKIFRKKKDEMAKAKYYGDQLRIATPSYSLKSGVLSGGNQQKVIISKLLCAACKLFIMDDPTRGIDIGAKVEVYKLINELTRAKCGVILISSEMPELIGMSDRIIVARDGTIVANLDIKDCTQEIIMEKIAGGSKK
ncbi:MAG: sugar ABC transporter ATP-binding protein [Synergistaceae bacterium]|jgi:ABC-type sugar transport system ATPase subunit|nr:sugar ABC transporter ATP-binding protein [Synergistaceae bacterium]